MYAIRVDPREMVVAGLDGAVSTEEALRCAWQAAVLAGAGNLKRVLCDLRGMERRPRSLRMIAESVQATRPGGLRLALVIRPDQEAAAARFAQMAGGGWTGVFGGVEGALRWLGEEAEPRLSATEARHYRELTRQWHAVPKGSEEGEARRTGVA